MTKAQTRTPPTAVLWDMDGTLIDQTAAIIRCYSQIIQSMGYPEPDPQAIRRSLGGPMASTMELFVETPKLDRACNAFRSLFPEIMFEGLHILPGSLELIQRFAQAQIPQALFTNKHGPTARAVSQHAHFDKYIPVCIGSGDTQWHKPDPRLTRHVLKQIHQPPQGAIIIGDSPTDVAVAQNADLRCYAVATGAHSTQELSHAGAHAAFESLRELSDALQLKP